MRSAEKSAELDEQLGFAGSDLVKFVEDVLNGISIGTISHRRKRCRRVDVDRKGRAIDPMLTTGTRIKTLRDVSADEKTATRIRQSYDPRNLLGAD